MIDAMNASGSQVVVKRYPTRMYVTCPACGHQGEVTIFLGDVGKVKCSKCGNKSPNVGDREPLRNWASERMAQNSRKDKPKMKTAKSKGLK